MTRAVSVANRHPRLRLDRGALMRALGALDARASEFAAPASHLDRPGELSVAFLTDADLATLHETFLDDPSPTDVITFDGNPAMGTAGEICVSADAAARFAAARSRDFGEELTLYVVHGWLHLAGCDDRTPASRRAMRRAERRAMAILREARAVPGFTWK